MKNMKISTDEIHDSLVATYQSLEASVLNKVLVENGITKPEQRREIISSFLFEQGVLLDQCWFKEQERKWYPGVYFSTQPHINLGQGTVHLASEKYGMNFHEYAHGAADWAIENAGNVGAIEVGNE